MISNTNCTLLFPSIFCSGGGAGGSFGGGMNKGSMGGMGKGYVKSMFKMLTNYMYLQMKV